MNVGELGEFELIRRIEALVAESAQRSPARGRQREVVLGIGDDAAILRPPAGHDVVVTTDAFVDGVHFRLDHESAATAGRRAMVANLSDLAAMGARPIAFTLALAMPAQATVANVLGMVRGMLREAAAGGCVLVGGNVTRAREISLSITAHGSVRRGRALRRDAGRAGDRLFLTGVLGRSALERHRGRIRSVPVPRLAAGAALGRGRGVGACIDISDGIVADLGHLARASGLGALLDVSRLPRPRGFEAACRRAGADAEDLLLGGGEDYELLFSVHAGAPAADAFSRRLGLPVTEVGVLRAGTGVEVVGSSQKRDAGGGSAGWRHF